MSDDERDLPEFDEAETFPPTSNGGKRAEVPFSTIPARKNTMLAHVRSASAPVVTGFVPSGRLVKAARGVVVSPYACPHVYHPSRACFSFSGRALFCVLRFSRSGVVPWAGRPHNMVALV